MCLPSSGRRLSGLSAVLLLSLFLVIRPAEPLPARDSVNITILETMTVPVIQNFSREYIRQIDRLGEETGTDYILTTLNAHGDREQALALLREQGSQAETDLIVSVATLASQAASEYIRGTGIPLLFTVVADPVGSGLVEEIGRHTRSAHRYRGSTSQDSAGGSCPPAGPAGSPGPSSAHRYHNIRLSLLSR